MMWRVVAMLLVALTSYMALALSSRARAAPLRQAAPWMAASALVWSTGLAALHALGMAAQPLPFAIGYDMGPALALWLGGALIAGFALRWAGGSAITFGHALTGGLALGLGVVGLQMAAVLSMDFQPGIHWRSGQTVGALLLVPVGCALALAILHPLRQVVNQGSAVHWLLPSAAVLSTSALTSQHLVLVAAQLPMQQSSVHGNGLSVDAVALLVTALAAALVLAAVAFSWHVSRMRSMLQRRDVGVAPDTGRDMLTRLPTRQTFDGTLAQAVHQADQSRQTLALLSIGLDSFAVFNEVFGHRTGDEILKESARRLRALALPHRVARLGGDEFLLLMPGNPGADEVSALAAKVLETLSQPHVVDGRELSTSCSIGIAMYPEHGALSTLIGHASAATRAAKGVGGGAFCLFESRMAQHAQAPAELVRDLRQALRGQQFELYYQPKVHAPSGQITGVEALIRWHHPKHGMMDPAVFIPMAERHGLIVSIGAWVIEEACRQARIWRDAGLRMRVAINLSVPQLRQADLAASISAALDRHQINPELLTCEITESVAMEDTAEIVKALKSLAAVGVHISIDDFGSGYSSLAYLRKLPANELKIDRGFVLDLETSEEARKVATAVINLAKTLDLKVVAEGVETEGQYQILRSLGCDDLQGYLFARPMTAKAVAVWAINDMGPRSIQFRESLFLATRQAVAH